MIKKLDDFIEKVSFYTIVIAVVLMLSLTVLNIVCRWFNTSFIWIDPLVRHLVFLSAFLGGVLATGANSHIRIDLASKLFEKPNLAFFKVNLDRLVYFVCIIATALLAISGYDLAKIELEFGKEAFLGIHSGALTSIIPLGMGMLGLRFLLQFLLTFKLFNKSVGES